METVKQGKWTFEVPDMRRTRCEYVPRKGGEIEMCAGERLIAYSETFPECLASDGKLLQPEEFSLSSGKPAVICRERSGTDHVWHSYVLDAPGTYHLLGYGTADWRIGGGSFVHNSLIVIVK